jgi:hypothetical protein
MRNTRLFSFLGAGAAFTASLFGMAGGCYDSTEEKVVRERAFQDAAVGAPEGWQGKVFKLSADYPATKPAACDKSVCTWLAIDADFGDGTKAPAYVEGKWADYMGAILDYVKQGQDPNLANDVGYRTEVGGKTRWFHVPWMAYDLTTGRDFIHGTTNERTASLNDFVGDPGEFGVNDVAGQVEACEAEWARGFETWAVGVYNEYGGWVFGQAFGHGAKEAGKPAVDADGQRQLLRGLPFPEGTLVTKFLTTNAPVDCVPYLKGSPEWQIHRHVRKADGRYGCERQVQLSRLIQVDVAVVDERSPTRWVYGTFAYDGSRPGSTVWDRLVAVGVQWGSDSKAAPLGDASSATIQESVINPEPKPFQHLGCNGRMNGPVDNKESSCISCHGGGFAPPIGTPAKMGTNMPPLFGFAGQCTPETPDQKQENAYLFTDAVYPAPPADPAYANNIPLDTSLQLFVALDQYARHVTNGEPDACTLDAN